MQCVGRIREPAWLADRFFAVQNAMLVYFISDVLPDSALPGLWPELHIAGKTRTA
ncbi:MAG: hypothetical protein H6Q05_4096 [Acidobacteria bacterium]|jgi:hypothetical protein|nr:hypothetical protein [Acidobacteriota bacterium]